MNNHTQNPSTTSVSDVCPHSHLIELSMLIGSIAESNAMFTAGLASYIEKIGKSLSELTVAELVAIIQEYRKAFNAGNEPEIERITVSPTKHNSLQKQHEIIGHALTIFAMSNTQENRLTAAQDTIELVRMLQDLPNDLRSTSRFNVLDKAKKLIAERVPFEQARQYQECIIKFSCMEVA